MNGKNIELLVENDSRRRGSEIMNEISKAGHHMWKCDGLLGNVSVLQQFYKLIFDFEKL